MEKREKLKPLNPIHIDPDSSDLHSFRFYTVAKDFCVNFIFLDLNRRNMFVFYEYSPTRKSLAIREWRIEDLRSSSFRFESLSTVSCSLLLLKLSIPAQKKLGQCLTCFVSR